jgi:hypothetical protein
MTPQEIKSANEAVMNKMRGSLSGDFRGQANDSLDYLNTNRGSLGGARGVGKNSSGTREAKNLMHRMRAAESDERRGRRKAGLRAIGGIKEHGSDIRKAEQQVASGYGTAAYRIGDGNVSNSQLAGGYNPNGSNQSVGAENASPSGQVSDTGGSVGGGGVTQSSDPSSNNFEPKPSFGQLGPVDNEQGGGDQDNGTYGSPLSTIGETTGETYISPFGVPSLSPLGSLPMSPLSNPV